MLTAFCVRMSCSVPGALGLFRLTGDDADDDELRNTTKECTGLLNELLWLENRRCDWLAWLREARLLPHWEPSILILWRPVPFPRIYACSFKEEPPRAGRIEKTLGACLRFI